MKPDNKVIGVLSELYKWFSNRHKKAGPLQVSRDDAERALKIAIDVLKSLQDRQRDMDDQANGLGSGLWNSWWK
jgi:hypothetical protein